MARRGENIYKRKDGRYEGRYTDGLKENGKPHYKSIYSYNYRDVKRRLTILKAQYSGNTSNIKNNPPGKRLISDWLDFWLEEIALPTVKPATYSTYAGASQRYLKPLLGEIPLGSLNSYDLQQFITVLKEKDLNPSYIREIFQILNSSLKKALKIGYIYANPCDEVTLPKKTNPKITPLTQREQKALEQAALSEDSSDIGLAVIFSLYTGMRIGEICALKWEDVDLEKCTINVNSTLQRITDNSDNSKGKTKIISGSPKSAGSERVIPIPPNIAKYIRMYKEKAAGKYVVSCKGSFTEPRNLRYRFQRLLKKSNLDPIRFHALRHTFATRCVELKTNITAVSKILGHSSVKMTLDIYTDATMDEKFSTVRTLEKNLFMSPLISEETHSVLSH